MKAIYSLPSIAAAALVVVASPAAAGSPDGQFQVKLLGTAVIPDGSLRSVPVDRVGLPANAQTSANSNGVPTLAIEYFITPHISVETICCVTQHDVVGEKGLAGTGLVSNTTILPATLTAKYHFGAPGRISPYVGVGPSYYVFIGEDAGATAMALGATRNRINDHFGVTLQAGVDVPVNNRGWSLSLDVKRAFVTTSSHWFNAAGTEIIGTRHRIDPWLVSAGVAFRF